MTALAAYDPETLDRAPVRFAAAAARWADVPLVIISVRASMAQAPRVLDALLEEELEGLRSALVHEHGIAVRTCIVAAPSPAGAARGLQSVIAEEGAGLVVVGSSRRGVIGQRAPGTTAQRVINGCACPVVVVPHGHDPPERLTEIGVAFVPTPEGRRALREAAAIARMSGADLRVLTGVRPRIGADASVSPAREAAERNRAQLEATLADAIADLADDVPTESEVLVDDPADALASVSRNLDLLVMGSRGYGPGLSVLLSSVSRRVTMKARCPVLVVPRGGTSAAALWAHTPTTTACTTYASETAARRAVEALTSAGVRPSDIWLLVRGRMHDVRAEAVGGFAGTVDPNTRVGTFVGRTRLRRQGAGAFAGDPDQQRQGSFADAELATNVSCEDGTGRSRVVDGVGLRRLLCRRGLSDDQAGRVLGELHGGRAVLLIDEPGVAVSDARVRLDELAHAG